LHTTRGNEGLTTRKEEKKTGGGKNSPQGQKIEGKISRQWKTYKTSSVFLPDAKKKGKRKKKKMEIKKTDMGLNFWGTNRPERESLVEKEPKP